MDEGTGRSLTRQEFDAVIRRAAELAESDPATGEGHVSETDLFRIAEEVGLGPDHVRRALADVRRGVESGGVVERLFGPSLARASRVVPGTPEGLSANLDEFLVASQLLQPVRRTKTLLQYRPSVDWVSQLARAASFHSRKYYLASARLVEIRLEEVDASRTLVEFLVDPGLRGDDVAGAAVGGGGGGLVLGGAASWGLSLAAPVALAIGCGVVVAGGFCAAVTYAVGRSHRKKLFEVVTELEGVLDTLEAEGPLEPPPPSWRRWVKRNFHGVARDLRGEGDGGAQ